MATIAFAYRSNKKEAFIQVRFLYRLESVKTRFSIYATTQYKVEKSFWEKYQSGTNFQGDNKDRKNNLDTFKSDISKFILNAYDLETDKSLISKQWLQNKVLEYHNPEATKERKLSNRIVNYIDDYIDLKIKMTKAQKSKWGVVQRKLERFEKSIGRQFFFKDIDEDFLKDFVEYYKKENYSENTTHREFGFIKTICKHAKAKGIETNTELSLLSLKKDKKVPKIFLSLDEIKKIQELKDLGEAHENARDWLIISCFTGQRVSDFMRFNTDMIRFEDNIPLLEFTQVKTGNEVSIPVLPEVKTILEKRGGQFPRKISDQRYNEYIKQVCKKAEINNIVNGRLKKNISEIKDVTKMRIVGGEYQKWEVISSHVGRRSFATNYYGKIATPYLINITGHSSEVMFLNYLGKSQKEISKEAYQKFANLV